MNEETIKLIETLAAKFGTTTEYLWGALVKQAPISGVCDTIICVVLIVGLIVSARILKSKFTELEDGFTDWREDFMVPAWITWSVVAFIVGLIVCCSFPTTIAAFVNPEYWALKQLIP